MVQNIRNTPNIRTDLSPVSKNPPHGPKEIAKNRQLALPKEVMEGARVHVGDMVYFQVQDDPPGSILLIPVGVVTGWIQRGRRPG